jgi:hypothetical protein
VVGRRRAGMEVQRHGQSFRRRPHLVVQRLVQVVALQVVVDQRPAKAELADAPTQFVGGRRRILHQQGREPAEPVRMSGYDLSQVVIGQPGIRPRGRRILAALQARDGEGQHLDVDARCVHLWQPELGEVRKPAGPVRQRAPAEPVLRPRRLAAI